MSDHEQLHADREKEADRLEAANERLGEDIDQARDARDRAASDDFIATPGRGERAGPGEPVGDLTEVGDSLEDEDDQGPPPEVSYTDKE
jgi:hypothetical protein